MNDLNKPRVTLKDIAKASGYTVNTVSHALRGMSDIALGTREKIVTIATEMGYVGNTLASSLRSGRSNTVAVIVSDVINPHFGYCVHNIERILGASGYTSIVLCTNDDEAMEEKAIKTAFRHLADGVILCPSQHSEAPIELMRSCGLPYVVMGRRFERNDNYALCDDEGGAFLLTTHLLKLGHRRILYVGGDAHFSSEHERRAGYLRALDDYGLAEQALVMPYERYVALEEAGRLIELLDTYRPTAIFAFRDAMAFTIINALARAGIWAPRDISVAGFDYIAEHLHFLPPLTTVSSAQASLSTAAANRLLEILAGDVSLSCVRLPMRVVDPEATVRGPGRA